MREVEVSVVKKQRLGDEKAVSLKHQKGTCLSKAKAASLSHAKLASLGQAKAVCLVCETVKGLGDEKKQALVEREERVQLMREDWFVKKRGVTSREKICCIGIGSKRYITTKCTLTFACVKKYHAVYNC